MLKAMENKKLLKEQADDVAGGIGKVPSYDQNADDVKNEKTMPKPMSNAPRNV